MCVQFLPRRPGNTTLYLKSKPVAVNKPNNVVATEIILYLSLIGLYKLDKYRLASKVVTPYNVEMKSNDMHFDA